MAKVEMEEAIDGALLSEPVFAQDWLKSEEDTAWAHLQNEDISLKNDTN